MKALICDICGRSENDLAVHIARIHRYNKKRFVYLQDKVMDVSTFDMCDLCLKRIADEMRKGKEK